MPPTNTADGTLQSMRIIHSVMLISMVLFIYMAGALGPARNLALGRILPILFGIVSLLVIGMVLYFRATKVRPALEIMQLNPGDPKALQQWRTGGVLTAVLLENVVLYGFALRLLGAAPKISLPFYLVGIALMLLWWPQRP